MSENNMLENPILSQEELLKSKINNMEELVNFLNLDNFILIVSNNEDLDELYKYTDNVIEDTNKLFKNNNILPIKLLFSEIEDLEMLFNGLDVITEANLPLAIKVSNHTITNTVSLKDFQQQLSLAELSSLLINDEEEINHIFDGGKEHLLVLTDDLDLLSKLLPEPIKNIHMLYKHMLNINSSKHKIKILFSDEEDIHSLFPSNTEKIPLPIVFKVDCTGTLKFPVYIKDVRNEKQEKEAILDFEKDEKYRELAEKYKEIFNDLHKN